MKMENINIPPKPYKCSVRRPVRSINGIEANVITTLNEITERITIKTKYIHTYINKKVLKYLVRTIIAPIPIVANFAFSSVKPALVNKNVE